jgi:hypothetical protein
MRSCRSQPSRVLFLLAIGLWLLSPPAECQEVVDRAIATTLLEASARENGRAVERHALALHGVPIEDLTLKIEVDAEGARRPLVALELAAGVEATSPRPTLSRAAVQRLLAALPGHPAYPGEANLLFRATVDRSVGARVAVVTAARLVWQVALYADAPASPAPGRRGPSAREIATVDAHTGELLEIVDNRVDLEALGHGFHNPGVVVEASATGNPGELCLGDRTRPTHPWSGYGCVDESQGLSVSTYLGAGRGLGPVLGSEGTFGDGTFATSDTVHFVTKTGALIPRTQTTAVDALYGLEKAYDFFHEVFRRSTLGRFGRLSLYVNVPEDVDSSNRLNNAWVERLDNSVWVGLSDATHPEWSPAADLKSMGHEYAHVVLASETGYPSDGWSEFSAVHEGFADVMGLLSAAWARSDPYGSLASRLEPEQWIIGDAISPALEFHRFFVRPSRDGRSVDAVGHANAQGTPYGELYGHYKAGVLRRWFFFLAKGVEPAPPFPSLPSPTYVDLGSPYLPHGLQGIGVPAAARVLYDHLITEALGPPSGFDDMAESMAAVANFAGERCSPTDKAVRDAWAAVNVGEPADRDSPQVVLDAHQDGQLVRIRATAQEEIDETKVRLEINGNLRGGMAFVLQPLVTGVRATGTAALPVSDIAWGVHGLQTVTLTVEDFCRNATSVSTTVAVDKAPPAIDAVYDLALERSSRRKFRFRAQDESGVASIQVAVGGSTTGQIALDPGLTQVDRLVDLELGGEPHGLHTVVATAKDRHGNTATRTFPDYFVDRLAPEACAVWWGGNLDESLRGQCTVGGWDGSADNGFRDNRNGVQLIEVWLDSLHTQHYRVFADGPQRTWFTSSRGWSGRAESPDPVPLGDHACRGICTDGWGNVAAAPSRVIRTSDLPTLTGTTSWADGIFRMRFRAVDLADDGDSDAITYMSAWCEPSVGTASRNCPSTGPLCEELTLDVSGSLAPGESATCHATAFDAYNAERTLSLSVDAPASPPPPPPPPDPGTGDVSFRLIWHGTADLDLYVKEPNGNVISYSNAISSTGGRLDVDANAPCGSNQTPVENVFWPTGTAPHGTYEFWVQYYGACGDSTSQSYEIEIRRGATLAGSQGGWVDEHRESNHYTYAY